MSMKVWLLIENEERLGDETGVVLEVYGSKAKANHMMKAIMEDHDYGKGKGKGSRNTDGWCVCCGLDWQVEGPYKVRE